MKTIRRQNGLGMIEVMVAALIMAIGILGYAAMQIRTLREASDAQYRMQALALAGDLVARVRANNGGPGTDSIYFRDSYASVTQQGSCLAQQCNAAALATADVYAISQQLRRLLPNADISLAHNDDHDTWLVRVAWNGRQPSADQCTAALSADNNFETFCVTLEV